MGNGWGLISYVRSNPQRSVGCQRALVILHQTKAGDLLPNTFLHCAILPRTKAGLQRVLMWRWISSEWLFFLYTKSSTCLSSILQKHMEIMNVFRFSRRSALASLFRYHSSVCDLHALLLVMSATASVCLQRGNDQLCRASSQPRLHPHLSSARAVSVPLLLGPWFES